MKKNIQCFTKKDYKLFKNLVKLSQSEMIYLLSKLVKERYKKFYIHNDFLIGVGDVPIGLVAHMDTVFKSPPKNVYFDSEQGVIWSPEGLGADDRAGILGIIKILQRGYLPTIIFTTDEEIGGWGADSIIKEFPKWPGENNLKYLIQLDRHGSDDCVFYECDNPDFVKYVEEFGFIENFGTFTDICTICPEWGYAGVNVSIGYENEHSFGEIFKVGNFIRTLDRVCNMLDKADEAKEFIYIPEDNSWEKWYWYGKNYLNKWEDNYDENDSDFAEYNSWSKGGYLCNGCKKTFEYHEVIPANHSEGGMKYYCPDCCVEHVSWCGLCGTAYVPEEKSSKIYCPSCVKSMANSQNKNKNKNRNKNKNSKKEEKK